MALANEIGIRQSSPVVGAREGYDLVSSVYEAWHWFEFWRRNESPVVGRWVRSLEPGRFLDAGSGTGGYRSDLELAGHSSVSVDLSMEMLKSQMQRYDGHRGGRFLPLVQGDIQALPFKNASFDYLLCTRVLSHVGLLLPALLEFARVVKPGGAAMVSDVHPEHRYSDMSISRDGEKISIRTYKHPIAALKKEIAAAAFSLLQLEEYRFRDLSWSPPTEGFENIYDEPERPILYVCWLQRM